MSNTMRYYDVRVAQATSIQSAVIYNYLEFLYAKGHTTSASLSQLRERFPEMTLQTIRTALKKLRCAQIITTEQTAKGTIYTPVFLTKQATQGAVYTFQQVNETILQNGYNVDINKFWGKYAGAADRLQVNNLNALLKEWHKRNTATGTQTQTQAQDIDNIIKAGYALSNSSL